MLLHAEGGRGEGLGLTIIGVQQRQGALSAPIQPSLRDNQKKRERWTGSECEKRNASVTVRLKGGSEEILAAVREVRGK